MQNPSMHCLPDETPRKKSGCKQPCGDGEPEGVEEKIEELLKEGA